MAIFKPFSLITIRPAFNRDYFFFDNDLHSDWQNASDDEMTAWYLQYKDKLHSPHCLDIMSDILSCCLSLLFCSCPGVC